MQPYRITRNRLPVLTRTLSNTAQPNMPCVAMYPRPVAVRPFGYHHHRGGLVPRGFNPFAEVDSLFNLLDSATSQLAEQAPRRRHQRSFQPRFDVQETPEAFHLKGELPGLKQDDVQIEFADANTLTVHGRTVRERQHGDRSLVEGAAEAEKPAAIADADAPAAETASTHSKDSAHQPTVEDEGDENAASTAAPTPATTAAGEKAEAAQPEQQQPKNKARYWVSERSVGEFHRSFHFPGRVDHEAVKASLKDGLLSIEVPKVQMQGPKRIQVE